jgi:signal transduction histidine kinase
VTQEQAPTRILRRIIRQLVRTGHDTNVWPVVLVVATVLIPAGCLLWFMAEAMRNESFAVRQKLADVYLGQLTSAQARLERAWTDRSLELEKLAQGPSGALAFAKCVGSGMVDSVIIFDEGQHAIYPNKPAGLDAETSDLGPAWREAGHLEFLRKDFKAAARIYSEMAATTTNVNLAARGWQAAARCLVQAQQTNAALRLIDEVLAGERYRRATDPQGRLIVANAELMALELIANPTSSNFQSVASRLRERLMDYENPVVAATQRRFLMKELVRLSSDIEFPTLAAEERAAQFQEMQQPKVYDSLVHRVPLTDMWHFTTSSGRVLALLQSDKLLSTMRAMAAPDNLPSDVKFTLVQPGVENDSSFVSLPAGSHWPGWRLALSFEDQNLFVSATKQRIAMYLWTGTLVVGIMGVLTLLVVRFLRHQAALARLKNDLAATVSHELKTPLASMRVLVDTLLDSDQWEEQKVREYLQLIAQENERLSRLIHNFLTFSRMDRTRQAFQSAPVQVTEIIKAAVQAVHERFDTSDCRFEVMVEADLPIILGDLDALTTALINLLENAWKYCESPKHIALEARTENGMVLFSVRDNGIGIAPGERKKIFRRFYQVDQRLSRRGNGCGLGLSIVEFITNAHHGKTLVESKAGCGSTFTICLPAAQVAANTRKEVFD